MTARSNAARPWAGHGLLRRLAAVLVLITLLGVGIDAANPSPAAAATGPKVAIIVGPSGSATAANRTAANAAAHEALHYTTNVVKVYSPYATWRRVKAAISGAAIVVYFGRGLGYPSPNSTSLKALRQDGFGLNPVSGANNSTTRFYGESYIRGVRLASRALVILDHATYASGNSAAGRREPTLSVAHRRVDNYASGFLAAGASVVIAESSRSVPVYYIRSVFTRTATLASVWRTAPTYHGHISSFTSRRAPGAVGRTDPARAHSRFTRSIAGWLGVSTTVVRTAKLAPAPVLNQKVAKLAAGASKSQFLSLTKDMTVDVIEMAGGTYTWDNVEVSVDRTARPLTIRPASGATVTFAGNGSTTAGIFSFGQNSYAKWITMDGGTAGGFTFSGIKLSQCGVFEVRSSDHLTLRNMTFKGLSRDPTWSDKAYKSWAAYISTAGGRNNNHLVIDRWTLLAPTVYRDVSAIQTDSSSVPNGSITLSNITMTKYLFGFYGGVPTANLVLNNWKLTDTGNPSTPASIRFTAVDINGSYSGITQVSSEPLSNASTGTMVHR